MNNCTKKTYMGAKYVPTIESNPQWSNEVAYKPLTMVTVSAGSGFSDYKCYISRQYVPVGIAITNTDYWALFWEGDAASTLLTQRVTQLEEDVNDNSSDITTLQGQMSTANSDIDTLQSDMSTAEGDISELQNNKADKSSVTALDTRLDGVDGGTANTGDTIQEANTKISTMQGQISTIQGQIAGLPNITYSNTIPAQTAGVTCTRILRGNVTIGETEIVFGWGSWSTPASSSASLVFLSSGETSTAFTTIINDQTGTITKTGTNSTNNGINIAVSDSQAALVDVSFMCVLN